MLTKEYQFILYITVQFNKNAFKNHNKWKVKKKKKSVIMIYNIVYIKLVQEFKKLNYPFYLLSVFQNVWISFRWLIGTGSMWSSVTNIVFKFPKSNALAWIVPSTFKIDIALHFDHSSLTFGRFMCLFSPTLKILFEKIHT